MIYTVGHSTLALDELVALLRDAGIRGIADVRRHPGSRRLPWFAAGVERLKALARSVPTAAMCAEAPWWRCHRRLLAAARATTS